VRSFLCVRFVRLREFCLFVCLFVCLREFCLFVCLFAVDSLVRSCGCSNGLLACVAHVARSARSPASINHAQHAAALTSRCGDRDRHARQADRPRQDEGHKAQPRHVRTHVGASR
jgi:hypothetical protein